MNQSVLHALNQVSPTHNHGGFEHSLEILNPVRLHSPPFRRKHLTQAFDSTNVQIVRAFQLHQFVATCNVPAIEPAIGDVPCIVFAAMQSDCESLFLQLRHDFIAFLVLCGHIDSVAVVGQTCCSQLHSKDQPHASTSSLHKEA